MSRLHAQEVKEIHIKAIPGLQFDLVRFQVEPGQAVRLTFSNLDDMGHNVLITKPWIMPIYGMGIKMLMRKF